MGLLSLTGLQFTWFLVQFSGFKVAFLKVSQVFEFPRLAYAVFHSIMVDEKKGFLKTL